MNYLGLILFLVASLAPARELTFYVGTLGSEAKGVWRATLDAETGKISTPVLLAEIKNASFLALRPDGSTLYATTELADGSGGVSALKLNSDGTAKLLNAQPTGGKNCNHLAVDATGRNLAVANYGSGSVGCLRIKEDGSLGELSAFVQHEGKSVHPVRQTSPHAHGVYFDSANQFLAVPDLGVDQIFVYRFDADRGALEPCKPASVIQQPGDGPRHFTFHPTLPMAYACNELTLTVTAFHYDAQFGTLQPFQVIETLPANAERKGASAAEIFCHPSGRTLYVSNRIHDSLAVFAIGEDGSLKLVQHQLGVPATPRGFGLTPDGQWLVCAGQKSGTLNAYRVNAATGLLTDTLQAVPVGSASCVLFAR
jgi:6-phosphogluconolactonase